jgi:alpha-beta hydrolase superfamily lysophospholipase
MTIDRRSFIQSAALAVGGSAAIAREAAAQATAQLAPAATAQAGAQAPEGAGWLPVLHELDPNAPPPPKPDGLPPPQMRRFAEQRWILDNVIRANGIDWDQPRLPALAAALGPEATADVAAIRQRVQKFADIAPAFEAVARRREARAVEAEQADNAAGARDNYFMAANYWASAQWPIDENNAKNIFLNQKKRECFLKYGRLAEHRVEPAWIALDDKALPGWFHLPYGYQSGRVPCVVSIPGMDGYKERSVALAGDRFLSRGIAVLVVEGPGQYESAVLGIRVSVPRWRAAGPAMFNWLAARPEIDAQKIAIVGASFGSLFSTIAAAAEPRYAAVAVASTCLEPGCHTIFEEASPTFKKRFMYMSGIVAEPEFDEFRASLSWEGHAEKIAVPYLCVVGEADELCPLEHTERMFRMMSAPRQLVIYAESRHSVGGVPSTNLGPAPSLLSAEWIAGRLAGKPVQSERWYVDSAGRVAKTAYA